MNERKQKTKHPLIEVRSYFFQNKKNKYIFISIFVFSLFAVMDIVSRFNYPLFHSFADMITVFIAASVFVIIWNGRYLLDNHYYLCISIGFLFFAFFDFLHLLGNKGMGVFPQFGNMGPEFYIVSRYILSISFLLAPFFIKRKIKTSVMFTVYSLVSILILLSIFYWKNFPVCYVDGVGLTPFKIISDYVIDLFFLGAIILLLFHRRAFDARVLRFTLFSLILSIGTGLSFTLYSDPFGIMNKVGHFLQIASFYLIYVTFVETGLAKPQNLLFRNLTQKNEERAAELLIANKELVFQRELISKSEEIERFFSLDLDLLCIADIEGNFLKVNKAWESKLGYHAAELEKRKFLEFVHPEDIEKTIGAMSQLSQKNHVIDFVNRYLCKDGTYKDIEWNSQPYGNLIYAAARDVTERKMAESALAQKQIILEEQKEQLEELKSIAEKANAAKSDFLSNMSHEIRTPLNAIVGFSELTLKTNLTEKQYNYIKNIVASSKTLLGLISDILDLSKIEADKLELEAKPFSIEEMLEGVLIQASPKSRNKGLELLVSIDDNVPVRIIGDSLRLGQILANLVDNAIKFTNEGEITIKVKLVQNGGDSALIQFSVKDTGIGLTEEQIKNLFQPFTQAETSTTRKYGGTGLGLAISRKLGGLMDGDIWVESEEGKGSTFFFKTRFKLAGKERFGKYKNMFENRNLKVLVVDAKEESREIIKSLLTGISFDVTTSPSGEEALALLEKTKYENSYDLVIIDWKMPGMDGMEASERIKRLYAPGKAPNIIMLTAYGSSEIQEKAEKIGIGIVLDKPVTPSLLLNAILDVCCKKSFKQISISHDKKEDMKFVHELHGIRVLLVEDNEINQEVAVEILTGEGMTVTISNNGREALDMVKTNTYDIVLMDVQMPIMDGYEATREMRKDPAFTELPIIAMTASALQSEKEKCFQAGMNDHITKPIDIDELFQTIGRWVRKEQDVMPEIVTSGKPASSEENYGDNEDLTRELAGIDVQAGLSHLDGNRILYRKLLLKFYEYHKNAMEEIRQALDQDDLKTAEMLTHTIKGAAGNLGAQAVYAAASELTDEFSSKRLDNAEPLLKKLEQALEQAFTSIALLDQNTEEVESNNSDEADIPVLKPVIDKLEKLLCENDIDSLGYVEEFIKQTGNTIYAEKAAKIKDYINRYNFEDALGILQEISDSISEVSKDE